MGIGVPRPEGWSCCGEEGCKFAQKCWDTDTPIGRVVTTGDGVLQHIECGEDLTVCGKQVVAYPLHWDTTTIVGCAVCFSAALRMSDKGAVSQPGASGGGSDTEERGVTAPTPAPNACGHAFCADGICTFECEEERSWFREAESHDPSVAALKDALAQAKAWIEAHFPENEDWTILNTIDDALGG
jgi:hypothetical protein